jgi:hypothetical protein
LSRTIARYSTRVPGAIAAMSWNTRYGSLSSVPIVVQSPAPTFAWKVTS